VEEHKYHNKMFYIHYANKPDTESTYVFEMVKNIHVDDKEKTKDGKVKDKSTPHVPGVPFKKHSILSQYLPYWKVLEVPIPSMLWT
jgi:hypothetical protein